MSHIQANQKKRLANMRFDEIEDRNEKLRELIAVQKGRSYICFYNRLAECHRTKTKNSKLIFPLDMGLSCWKKPAAIIEAIKILLKYDLIEWNAAKTGIYII